SAVRTVRTQGLFSYREDYRTQVDTSTLPPPDPWLEPAIDTVETGRMSPCRRDGSWFLKLLHAETKRMEGWCKEMEREAEENDLSEEKLLPAHALQENALALCQREVDGGDDGRRMLGRCCLPRDPQSPQHGCMGLVQVSTAVFRSFTRRLHFSWLGYI
ncbi:DLG associated protein 2, partial [Homo sapiens]